ncbi:ABC transporter ATP-binding protein [Alteromonas sediminis]|uniref:ABC transporter ATP-binding protein n=1 Tax=Alteromonas sediminis TaxID=2259342 RepID=A0A3N5Z619_9ALTE|nr:ABC transporter ATP-binding protein [Alteromonas sediminis]RPJ65894.1 ABC transporter ATP-binding protein [Alteromonas sediminis]
MRTETATSPSGLMQLLKPHRPSNKQFSIMGLLVLITAVFELAIPLLSKFMIDNISQSTFEVSMIAALVAIVLLAAIFEGGLAWYGSHLGETTNKKLRFSVFSHLLHAQQSALNNEHSAELSARVVNDSMSIKSILAEDLIGFISGLVSIFAVVIIMFFLDWRLTLVLVACIVAGIVLITPLAMSMRGIGMAMQEAEAQLIANVSEWLRSAKTIKVHNASSQVLTSGQTLLDNAYHHAMRQARVLALIGPISNLILMVSMIAILATSAIWLADGSLTLGTVTAFLIYLFGLAFPIMAMGMFFSNVQRASGAAERMQKLLQIVKENTENGDSLAHINHLEVKALTYTVDEKTVLKNINWQLPTTGLSMIIGESGSGKSSFIQQLVGLYPETLDSVHINNKPLSAYCLNSVRAKIAWLEQQPSIFIGSVRDNLCIGLIQKPSDQDIIDVLSRVGLGEWLKKHDAGLDLLLSEQLNTLSGGERQRFALARALLRDPELLILDEPTSALDKESEQSIMQLLRSLANNICVLMVTHNRRLIEESDHVLCLKEGTQISTNPYGIPARGQ